MRTKVLALMAGLLLTTGVLSTSMAQSYRSAIGLNIGSILGVNYKQFIGHSNSAMEINFGYQRHGVMLSGVYQFHFNLVDELYLYVGGGVNVGMVNLNHDNGKFALGIDPTVGFEYKFREAPIALAVDYTPQINIFSPMNFSVAAFKIRFTL